MFPETKLIFNDFNLKCAFHNFFLAFRQLNFPKCPNQFQLCSEPNDSQTENQPCNFETSKFSELHLGIIFMQNHPKVSLWFTTELM